MLSQAGCLPYGSTVTVVIEHFHRSPFSAQANKQKLSFQISKFVVQLKPKLMRIN